MRLSYLVRGFPGHPLHPPLTDATIGAYTTATVLGILAFAGVSEGTLTRAWWLALLVGLRFLVVAAWIAAALAVTGWLPGLGAGEPLPLGGLLPDHAESAQVAQRDAEIFGVTTFELG